MSPPGASPPSGSGMCPSLWTRLCMVIVIHREASVHTSRPGDPEGQASPPGKWQEPWCMSPTSLEKTWGWRPLLQDWLQPQQTAWPSPASKWQERETQPGSRWLVRHASTKTQLPVGEAHHSGDLGTRGQCLLPSSVASELQAPPFSGHSHGVCKASDALSHGLQRCQAG